MRQNPHVRICGGPGSATTLVYPTSERSRWRDPSTAAAHPAGRFGGASSSDRFRGQPHRHIAAANEGPVVGRPVRYAIFRLVCGMDLRLHPCRVAPAEGPEKCRPNRPTPAGSCRVAPEDCSPEAVGLEFVIRPPLEAGPCPGSGRSNAHG